MTTNPAETKLERRLLWHGMLLFLLGLLTGFVVPALKIPRMGLASHLEGVMNGMLLAIVGCFWTKLRLSERKLTVTFWLLLYGTYSNWATTLLSAIWGAAASMPLAGGAMEGRPWQEYAVLAGLWSCALTMLVAIVMLLCALRQPRD
jgi:hydroxylaminobenzene mutase